MHIYCATGRQLSQATKGCCSLFSNTEYTQAFTEQNKIPIEFQSVILVKFIPDLPFWIRIIRPVATPLAPSIDRSFSCSWFRWKWQCHELCLISDEGKEWEVFRIRIFYHWKALSIFLCAFYVQQVLVSGTRDVKYLHKSCNTEKKSHS